MTAPVFIAPVGYPRYCRLLTVGVVTHVTACLARIAADEPLRLTAEMPPDELFCAACRREIDVHRARAVTIDLGPRVRELAVVADLSVDVWERRREEQAPQWMVEPGGAPRDTEEP